MIEQEIKAHNPYSTGGGGNNFETQVQAFFVLLMVTGSVAPCLPQFPIKKIKLQGKYDGYDTDDFILFAQDPSSEEEVELLAQIKHEISITANNALFAEVIKNAWNDFNKRFSNSKKFVFALITGPLSSNDIKHVRPILDWARCSEDENEFLKKINTKKKKEKKDAFKIQLKKANNGIDVSDEQLWMFLKSFHLICYDLDTTTGIVRSIIQSLIRKSTNSPVQNMWERIVYVTKDFNQNAGTITLGNLPQDIQEAFNSVHSHEWLKDIKKLKVHGAYILSGIKSSIGELHLKRGDELARLIKRTNTAQFVLVTGTPGCGKSSLIKDFCNHIDEQIPVFCLRTEDLEKPHLSDVFSALGFRGAIDDVVTGLSLIPKKYLIIESLERLLELNHTAVFSDLLQLLNRSQGWTVLASCREYALGGINSYFFQSTAIKYTLLSLNDFNESQIEYMCQQLPSLQSIAKNPKLRKLIKNPFLADLAYTIIKDGVTFANEDGEREFRLKIWQYVIVKEQQRFNGMPIKRESLFIDIAVKRARLMSYGVAYGEFNPEVLSRLEEDNLIRLERKKGLVSLAHDVYEDWAIEKYIEQAYHQSLGKNNKFLAAIGNEPAMRRAFRLWLSQKLKYDEDITAFMVSIMTDPAIQTDWRDEVISAVLQGEHPDVFLNLIKDRLFLDEARLLKRFCFVLTVSCQIPAPSIGPQKHSETDEKLHEILFLTPYGIGWKAIIGFIFQNKERITPALIPDVVALINNWVNTISITEAPQAPACEAGLLALYFLEQFKDSYRNNGDQVKLLRIIIRTSPVIQNEFKELLDSEIFINKRERRAYGDQFCDVALLGIESAFLCKQNPDIVIKLAFQEWLIEKKKQSPSGPWGGAHIDVKGCFGLHCDQGKYDPIDGIKGPFQFLLRFHPLKGIDFILKLLNISAKNYAFSNLDFTNNDITEQTVNSKISENLLRIILNDGVSVEQFYSCRLWLAYRGHSGCPNLLVSALMALEWFLINYVEKSSSSQEIEWLFDHILQNSNSVTTTAVLAAVAVGYPQKIGKAVLPLLRTPELYFMETMRLTSEFGRYADYPWRKRRLEDLAFDLQFTALRDEVLSVIDMLKPSVVNTQKGRFLLSRMDSREGKIIYNEDNKTIIFQPKELEPDLALTHQNMYTENQLNNRFVKLDSWARKMLKRESSENEFFSTWNQAFDEARELHAIANSKETPELVKMLYGSIVTSAAIFLRDYANEITQENIAWCNEQIIHAITTNADTDNYRLICDKTDGSGAAAASVLPILLDFTTGENEKTAIKKLIVLALTDVNEEIRHAGAEGVREHLWQRDYQFAQNCVAATIEFARFKQESLPKQMQLNFPQDQDGIAIIIDELKQQIEKFRHEFLKGVLLPDLSQITFETHSSWHILSPCLMIPDSSQEPNHVVFLSRMLMLLFEYEEQLYSLSNQSDALSKINHDMTLLFKKYFSNHLLTHSDSAFSEYIELLKQGCTKAPRFITYVMIHVAAASERGNVRDRYWLLWQKFSEKLQEIANLLVSHHNSRKSGEQIKLIRYMLHADTPWQKVDYKNQNIALGKELIIEFATNAGKNPHVFEALASLVYHFPTLFFEKGIMILAELQNELSNGDTRLFSGSNTAFYLEISIQRFLQIDSLSKALHDGCFTLINAMVETGSSRAYYLRDRLICSRPAF